MKLRFSLISLAAVAAALTGCLTQEQTFHLNPDGSGKLELAMTVDTNMMGLLGGGAVAGQDMGKEIVLQLLRGTEGVDAWGDLKYENAAGGKTKIEGTAFFKDINNLHMSAGEQAGGATSGTLTSKRDGDSWTVAIGLAPAGSRPPAASNGPKLSAEQVKTRMEAAKGQWEQSKSFVGPLVQDAKMTTTVKAGGTIKESVGFAKVDDRSAALSFGGSKVIAALDTMISDPKLMEEALAQGGDFTTVLRDQERMQKALMESLTDGKGMPSIELKPGEPILDYDAEVAKARENQTPALKALLEEAAKPKGAVIRPPAPQRAPRPATAN